MAKGDSPYTTSFASSNIDFDMDPLPQMKKYKKEEKETHTGLDTLPYEMGSLPIYFGEMVNNALQASKVLNTILDAKEFKHKKDLAILKNNIDKIVHYLIKNVDNTLDKFTIGSDEDN